MGKGEERNLTSSNSSKKDNREKKFRRNAKKLEEEYSKKTHISLRMSLNLCYHYQ
ncbi:MAG TPA: hypothetical protein VE223_06720 [Nitrososphaeraceae archaeon]|nr:hypothetical protein [Nitrososphaeraceae archaeon]